VKTMVWTPSSTRRVIRRCPSTLALRRIIRAGSLTGGFQKTTCRRPRGEPSRSTRTIGTCVSASASSCGLAMVADEQMNCGRAP